MDSKLKAVIKRQRRQWNRAATSWVQFVRSGKNYYAEYLNGPALKEAVGNVRGKRVLDIGCGEGCFSRFFASVGAEVTGVDLSEAMIKAAIEEEENRNLGIKYYVADAANLHMLSSGTFDVAYCHMALDDIADYWGAIAEASRVLKAEGRFVILMEHPCFDTRSLKGKMVGGWKTRPRKDGSVQHLYYQVEDYFQRHSYTCEWKMKRLTSSFVTTSFHRTLSDYANALAKHGFVITKLNEPRPLEEGTRLHPGMKKHHRIPFSLVIEAVKVRVKKEEDGEDK